MRLAHGLRVQPPGALYAAVIEEWGQPELIVCDRFRLGELRDCVNGTQVIPRVSRWSEAGEDIRSLRRLSKDGPLSVEHESRALFAASFAVAMVKNDDQGNTRLVKKGSNNSSRDDVAAALVLGAGVYQRARSQPKRSGAYLGIGLTMARIPHPAIENPRRWQAVRASIRFPARCLPLSVTAERPVELGVRPYRP